MAERLLIWIMRQLIRRVGLPTLLSLLLLLTALGSLTLGLAGVIRGFDTGLMLFVVGFGLLAGWELARSPLPGWLAGLVILVLGSEAIALRVGQLGRPLAAFLWTLARLARQTWRWPVDGPPNERPVLLALTELWTDLNILLVRLFDWLSALANGQPAYDPVAATLVWGLVLWLVAAWAAWAVRRLCQPLPGLTPAGALLVITFAYTPDQIGALAPLLGATLLLIALVGHGTRENRWQTTGVDFPVDLRLDLTMAVIPLTLSLILMAWMAPSLSVRQIAKFAQRLIGGQVAQAQPLASSLGVEPRSGPASALEKVRAGGLPRRHLIGSGPELSEQVVMVVQTDEPPPASPDYYWRSITYDRYTGHGWFTGRTKTVEYGAGEPTIPEYDASAPPVSATSSSRRILQQEVRVVGSLGGLLYTAGELITTDRDFSVAWRAPGDYFGATIEPATAYRAKSMLPVVGETQLRSAGSNYPEWIRRRYLAVPDETPRRVLALARDLTATAPTPYDRAKAIESHLRAFPYSLDLPAPPANRDIVDYFLFDLQQGYCDYYATSMVVLARAAGLPARLAVGYINGTYDAVEARYVVTEAEAHSWVEIYFPGYGWINFEPTGGRPALERPDESGPVVPPELEAPFDSASAARDEAGGGFGLWLLTLPGGVALLALLGGIAWSIADGWRLRRLPPAEAVTMLYRRLYHHGRRLDAPLEAGDTPYEFAASLAEHVTGLTPKRRWQALLTPAAQEVRWLTDLYVQTLYSPHRPDLADRTQAIQIWRRLRRRLWLILITPGTARKNG